MSWLKAIAGGVIGAEALSLIKDYVEKQGGLDGVVKNFENSGLGKQIHSWVGLGPNEKISEMDISKVVNADKLMEIAKNAGVDIDKAKALLAQYLPEAIDKATPEGKLPPPDKPA
ncbi:MAG: YidB family protein [Methylocystis silviterrae]|uniref:YidB family protein n=1 Tax=Methylocystis TaxID=133 RepID=UPI0018C1E8FB|nr:YidB family protein [Methylocystis sp. H4A]MBG0802702.1 DUF937 domain-containing protein [Methylocystis sp. H4A]